MKKLLISLMVAAFAQIAVAQEIPNPELPPPNFEYAMICDTQEQVEYAISVFEDFKDDAPHEKAVNEHFKQEGVCAYAFLALYLGEPVKTVTTEHDTWVIVPVLVVGLGHTQDALRHVKPMRQWSAKKAPKVPGTDITNL